MDWLIDWCGWYVDQISKVWFKCLENGRNRSTSDLWLFYGFHMIYRTWVLIDTEDWRNSCDLHDWKLIMDGREALYMKSFPPQCNMVNKSAWIADLIPYIYLLDYFGPFWSHLGFKSFIYIKNNLQTSWFFHLDTKEGHQRWGWFLRLVIQHWWYDSDVYDRVIG